MSETQPGPARPALIAEATKRAGLIWITVPGSRPRPAWHVWRAVVGGPAAAYLLTGPGEQPDPGLATASQVTVTVASKDSGGAVARWTAAVTQVDPASAEWAEVLPALLAGRLNEAPSAADSSPAERWARTAALYRLTPEV